MERDVGNGALRILIVEHDLMIAEDLADLLSGLGHEVCAIALTEAQAVSAAARFAPDLMIVDGQLADGSGVSAVRRISAHGVLPHAFFAGDPPEDRDTAWAAIVVFKPYDLDDLTRAIARVRPATKPPAPRPPGAGKVIPTGR